MHPRALQFARGERVIAAGRLMLAVFSLLALQLDREVDAGARVIAAVAVYAVALAAAAWLYPFSSTEHRIAVHLADFLLYSLLIQVTHASVSPFFVFFLFAVFSALLRFGVRGTLITAGAAILVYVTLALLDDRIRSDPAYLVVRVASLCVATLLLVYLGVFHERIRDELAKLASWPRPAGRSREEVVLDTLARAREVLRAPRAVLAWEDADEPWVWCAIADGSPRITREAPEFLDRLDERFPAAHVVSTTVSGDTVQGRLLFLDRADFSSDDATLAEIVGRLVATRIDQIHVAERMREAAVGEERIRVARDLHDGLLQSLTGAALQLESALKLVGVDDEAVQQRLRRVQELIEHDQRELRSLISELRLHDTEERTASLGVRLLQLAERFERQWEVAVSVFLDPPLPSLSDELAGEIYSLVSEGVANAAKHARASRIDATVRSAAGHRVEITIQDDGRGFPFQGEFDLRALNELRRGPVTLKERVASLGGELLLRSTPEGTTLQILI